MFERSPESIEMRTPAIVSAMLHVVVLAAAVLNLDFFSRPPLMEPEPVMVEFEAIDKKAAAPTVGNPPPQPKDVPIAEEATKAPPPKTADPPPAPEKPKLDVAEAKPPPPPPVEKPKPEVAKPADDLDRAEAQGARAAQGREAARAAQARARGQEARAAQAARRRSRAAEDRVDSMIDDILKNKQSPQKHADARAAAQAGAAGDAPGARRAQPRRRRDGERDRGRAQQDPAVLESRWAARGIRT